MNKTETLISRFVKHPFFSGSIIMVGGNMTANVVNYVYHLVMGRILGPANYGVLASLYSILYLIGIIPAAASVAVVKFISSTKDENVYSVYSTIYKFVLKWSAPLSIVALLLSPLVANFLHIKDVWSVAIISPILFLNLPTLVNQATSQGLLQFLGTVVPTFFSSLTKLILGVALVYLGFSVFGAMAAVLIGLVLAFLVSRIYVNKNIKISKVHTFDLKPFLVYSLPVLVQALAFTSLFTVDVLLVKHFFSPFDAGIYAAISTLGKIIFFASSPIAATMFPLVSRRKASSENYQKIFLASFLITALLGISITLFYWLFPNIAIGVLYGPDYLAAKGALVWMAVFMVFYSLSNLLVNYFFSLGDSKVFYFPLSAAVLQILMVWFYHPSLIVVIQVSLVLVLTMFMFLLSYLGYNRAKGRYA